MNRGPVVRCHQGRDEVNAVSRVLDLGRRDIECAAVCRLTRLWWGRARALARMVVLLILATNSEVCSIDEYYGRGRNFSKRWSVLFFRLFRVHFQS